jgi:hypothetical protein
MMDIGAGGTGVPAAPPEPDLIPSPPIGGGEPMKRPGGEEPDPDRAALVKEICEWAKLVRKERGKTFAKMRRDMDFVRPGRQWRGRGVPDATNDLAVFDHAYEANITQRHVQQRVAALYAKNPKVVARRRKRLDFEVWDGSQKSLKDALARAMGSPGDPGDPMTGVPPTLPTPPAPTPEDIQLLQDVEQGVNRRKMLDRVAKTLEMLYTYYLEEGTPAFKSQAKQLIRRVETTGVGFVQLGFQRIMEPNTEIANAIRDDQEMIGHLEALSKDMADGELEKNDCKAKIEELKLGLEALQAKVQVVLREGLVFDFPASTDILVDLSCVQLKGFIGAKRVAREYHYTKQQVKEIFNVDLGDGFTQYAPTKTWEAATRKDDRNVACVWAVWDVDAGNVYYVCDGYKDFLKEPEGPQVVIDGFFPFKVLSFNDIEDQNDIYPPSDVEIIRPMQLEYNRAREGLREHRIANKPGYVVAKGMLDDEDKTNLANHAPNELIELNVPPDAVKEIAKYIGARPQVEIKPEVYDTEYLFTDFQRVAGDQAANLGGSGNDVTATEASIAETSRVSSLQSCIDDVNDFLSDMARAAGQILFAEMSPEQVVKIVGPGAVWPALSREEISEEILLQIEAGSSGRPNKAVEIANMERMMPFLIQMPGLSKEWLARQALMRLDENVELEDAFEMDTPSVVAQNAITSALGKGGPPAPGGGGQVQPGTGKPNDPKAQGPAGADPHAGQAGVNPHAPGPKPDFPVLNAPEPVA